MCVCLCLLFVCAFVCCLFVCLLGFNVAFKHLRAYRNDACLSQWYYDQCAAKQKYHAADTGHDIPPRNSIQTQSRPVH